MVAEVGVHDDDEVARRELQAVHVCRSQTQLPCAWLQDYMRGICLDQLLCYDLCSVGRAVIDDYEFPFQVTAKVDKLD